MSNRSDSDTNGVARSTINIRSTTFKALDKLRPEIEKGKKMSWDEWFRKLLEEDRLGD